MKTKDEEKSLESSKRQTIASEWGRGNLVIVHLLWRPEVSSTFFYWQEKRIATPELHIQ
jgi:hypothetical protein